MKDVVEVTDRSPVHVRAIRATDASELRAFYARLSPESRRTRFFSVTAGLSRSLSVSFCSTDHDHREGFVAVFADRTRADEQIVGHLCLEPDGAATAEVAIAVADSFQSRGLGRQLMALGLAWARTADVARFSATMIAANAPIHRLLVGLGLPTHTRFVGAGVVEITIDLAAETVAA
jgi:acetyltransferase